jgi:hypothetical protein
MNDLFAGQFVAVSNLCIAGFAAVERLAFVIELGTSCAVNGAIDPTAA